MIRDCHKEVYRESLRGGKGLAGIKSLIANGESLDYVSFVGLVRLEPGASIGYHLHEGEGEIYYILSGEGLFHPTPDVNQLVKQDDMTYIFPGEGHGITNTSDEDLVILAIVYNNIDLLEE